MKFPRRYLHIPIRQTTKYLHMARSTNIQNNCSSLISDIRSAIEAAEVCQGIQCDCVDIWECGKPWDTLKNIETILNDYEDKIQTHVSCETCNRKNIVNAVAKRHKDAWDVIG